MSDMKRRITEDEGSLQRLMASIPGFSGYRERQIRRKADELVRMHIVRLLDGLRASLDDAIAQWASRSLEHMAALDRARTRLGRARDAIRYADYGYTGWFDAVKIKEDELDAMYKYDLAMQESIGGISEAIDAVATAEPDSLPAQIEYLVSTINQLGEAISRREAVTTRTIPEAGPAADTESI